MAAVTIAPSDTACVAKTQDRTRGIVAFLTITFGLAWLPFLAVFVGRSDIAPILMPFAPAIACFVVRKWITREGFGDAGLRLRLRFRDWPLYLIALAWPFAVTFLSVLFALVLRVAPSGCNVPWGLGSPSLISLLTWSLGSIALAPLIFGEEFGWRGYLQVRLLADRPLSAAVATGLIWGVWHYPLILIGGERAGDLLLTVLLFPLGTVLMAIFLGWLRCRTGSVWAGSVAHAANNGLGDNLNRLAFTGRVDGIPSTSTILPSLLAEMLVLGGTVVVDCFLRQRTGSQEEGAAQSPLRLGRSTTSGGCVELC
jgi:membrane protease YdiL (CAAX protease family)